MSLQPALNAVPEFEFFLDGKVYVVEEDFTFKEQRAYRDLVRELAGDPTIQAWEAPGMDRWPAMVTVIKRRTEENYSVEQALEDYKQEDIIREKKPRPTRAASSRRASAS